MIKRICILRESRISLTTPIFLYNYLFGNNGSRISGLNNSMRNFYHQTEAKNRSNTFSGFAHLENSNYLNNTIDPPRNIVYSERGLQEEFYNNPDDVNSKKKFILINGAEIAAELREEIKREIEELVEIQKRVHGQSKEILKPGLAVVMAGNRKDSKSYVDMKEQACMDVGINSFKLHFPEDVTEEELIRTVHNLNQDPRVHGILIQLPLPSHLNEETILENICISKDVDGLTSYSMGKLSMKDRLLVDGVNFVPCTSLGVLELIRRTAFKLNRNLQGIDALVIGTSNIVGIPTALLLLNHLQTTVQMAHIKSQDIPEKVKKADLLIVSTGCAEMIQPEWIKPGAIVIDVGQSPMEDPTSERGYKMVGDVKFDDTLKQRASAATKVPGGVGPMTITMLLRNTLQSFKAKNPQLQLNQ
ncbi:hypothetical protein C9374_013455 [Naegleria lovaniensis]|uniref:Methenyltetrahydrofolate cyclohydrolase n=1 Tax=Naegleria lovaniensis TaxID=51637 RepID=A0AA88GVZ5_NAELO|nr:uncharacterized protein C9374_013455 [Naegleria lovaniensis]KAG2391970.1 hypothetical protein C9374_013455 [Naegleria lovaniensis]